MNPDKNITGKQPREWSANERKLLYAISLPWMTRAMALLWTLVAVGDYQHHHLSWIDGFLAGTWIFLALSELVLIGVYRRKHL